MARVRLVHGIWNARTWLLPFGRHLRRHGLQPDLFGYASVFGRPEQAAERLAEALRRDPVPYLVGHSLGGLVALEALRLDPSLPVERVVCLGSPLRGSRVAGAVGARPALAPLLGGSRALLCQGCAPWEGRAEVGVIAGNHPRGVGRLFAAMDPASDGTVNLEETRLPGLADHCEVPASHTGLALSAEAARQAARFLREGRFGR